VDKGAFLKAFNDRRMLPSDVALCKGRSHIVEFLCSKLESA
jgi:hypothetical protein